MLILQQLGYLHPNKDLIFHNINAAIQAREKVALIGNNGSGKSTLLQLIAGRLQPSSGHIYLEQKPWYVPQHVGQYNGLTVAEALGVKPALEALEAILNGQLTEANLTQLNNDWQIEERCQEALAHWELKNLPLTLRLENLSGGQKTKVFLAGIFVHKPQLILMDEPSNHLDAEGRALLYDLIRNTAATLVVVSHDRALLHLLNGVYELSADGMAFYGGSFAFYAEQKALESLALEDDIRNKEKALRKAKDVARDTAERRQRLDSRGKKKQEQAGLPTIAMKTFKNKAENSTSRMKGVHEEKKNTIARELDILRKDLPDLDQMTFGFHNSHLHKGKKLITAKALNYNYGADDLWKHALDLELRSGERVALKGKNGSGKTTLIKLLLAELIPTTGSIERTNCKAMYVDQEYSLITQGLTVYEQAQIFNTSGLQEHEVKLRLARFLFSKDDWDKHGEVLSGGEKMRLMLCCLSIAEHAPDLIILDEPTNNLDLQNLEILTRAVNEYKGTLMIVSHDAFFLEAVGIERTIEV